MSVQFDVELIVRDTTNIEYAWDQVNSLVDLVVDGNNGGQFTIDLMLDNPRIVSDGSRTH